MKTRVCSGSKVKPEKPGSEVGVDIETWGDGSGHLHPMHTRLATVQVVGVDSDVVYVVDSEFEELSWLEDCVCIGHGLQFDIAQLDHHANISLMSVRDTMVMCGLLDAARKDKTLDAANRKSHSLKSVVKRYLGKEMDKSIRDSFIAGASLSRKMIEYAAQDIVDTVSIWKAMCLEAKTLQPSEKLLKLEMALVPYISYMSERGLNLDVDRWETLIESNRRMLSDIDTSLVEKFGIPIRQTMFSVGIPSENFNSHVVLKRLSKVIGLALPSTSRSVLEAEVVNYPDGSIQREVLELLIKRSSLRTLISNFGEKWVARVSSITGRLHPYYRQTFQETGRISATNPASTTVPKDERYRSSFTALRDRKMVAVDYSQQEPRIIAALSGDEKLLSGFHARIDPYVLIAREMLHDNSIEKEDPERRLGKIIMLALFYGMGVANLAHSLGCNQIEAKGHIKNFQLAFPRAYGFGMDTIAAAERSHFSETVLGRRRYGHPFDPGFTGQMKNHPIQGSGADMTKLAIIIINRMFQDRGLDAFLVNSVHDELVAESATECVIEVARCIKHGMLKAASLLVDVPFQADVAIGDYWGDNNFNHSI